VTVIIGLIVCGAGYLARHYVRAFLRSMFR